MRAGWELGCVLEVVAVGIAKMPNVARVLDSRGADVTTAFFVRLTEFSFGLQPIGDRIA